MMERDERSTEGVSVRQVGKGKLEEPESSKMCNSLNTKLE